MTPAEERASFWARLVRSATREDAARIVDAAATGTPIDRDDALAGWEAARDAFEALEERLDAKARDLEALQSFGRGLAESRSTEELLDAAAAGLERLLAVDAVGSASAVPERMGVDVWVARPMSPEAARRFSRAIAHGLLPDEVPVRDERRLPGHDPFRGTRPDHDDRDVLVVPVLRRGSEVFRLGVLLAAPPTERDLRLAFGAANHLALHLDRVLAVAEAEQGRFRAILDSIPHAVVLLDSSFQVAQSNVSAEPLLNRLAEAGSLRSVGDLDLVGLAYDVLTGRSPASSAEARLADGAVLEVTIAPGRGFPGGVEGLVIVLQDVTTAVRLREQVARSEKLSGLGRLLAGVAHELNNPLTAVIGYAQLIPSMPPGEKAVRRLETLRREAERCRRIVQGLLRFARPHSPDRRIFSVNQVVADAVQLLDYAARSQGVELTAQLDRDIPAIVGDPHEIEQALVNLVANAQHAIAAAGRDGSVTITTRTLASGGVAIEVDDDGPGIPEELRPRVFDPFFSTKPEGQGTGLGLWLVYNAATSHGGRVEVAASDRGGARFRLELPRGDTAGARLADDVPIPERSGVSARILVADPEKALAELICEVLEADGHAVHAARDAEDVLLRLATEPFDLVVADAALPGLSPERLSREIARLRPELIDRVVLTSSAWERAGSEGFPGLLRKPFEIEDLRRVVRRQLPPRVDPCVTWS